MARLDLEKLDSLFSGSELPTVSSPHAVYVHIRDSDFCAEDRRVIDAMWSMYRSHVRPSFVKNFLIDFPSRLWEMQIGCALLDMGIEIRVEDEGPDICCLIGDRLVWIEAIAPNEGSGRDKVVQVAPGQVGSIPDNEIILRLTSAFCEKHRKFQGYQVKKLVHRYDIKVIAISGAKVPLADMEDIPYPRIVRAVLGLGGEVKKANGEPVPNTYFLDRAYSDISAVMFCRHHIKNSAEVRGLEPGRDWVWVHNPLAVAPLPDDFFSSGQVYRYHLQHNDRRRPLPKPTLAERWASLVWRVRIAWSRRRKERDDESEP